MTKKGNQKEATQKINKQENAENVAKFAGIDRHQHCCLILHATFYVKVSRGFSLALLETRTRVDIGSGA